MRKVYAVRNRMYIRYAIQILLVCALKNKKNASATDTNPRHNSPNNDQLIFTYASEMATKDPVRCEIAVTAPL